MYELKKELERYWWVNLLGPGPCLLKERIYWAVVSQRLRNPVIDRAGVCQGILLWITQEKSDMWGEKGGLKYVKSVGSESEVSSGDTGVFSKLVILWIIYKTNSLPVMRDVRIVMLFLSNFYTFLWKKLTGFLLGFMFSQVCEHCFLPWRTVTHHM